MSRCVEALLLSDTHLGFDLPHRPRHGRRRRGPDFFACYEAALQPALAGEVDLVIHTGDLFHRSRPRPSLVEQALAPLRAVAEAGVPVVLVPGNHERGRIPAGLLARHRRLHVIDRPATVRLAVRGLEVSVTGFPFERRPGSRPLREHLEPSALARPGEVALLALHQAVGGSVVGAHGYVFRPGPEVIDATEVPPVFAAVVAGHVHRPQLLREDHRGRALPVPVVHPGSVERTSFAERTEPKGYARLTLAPGPAGGRLAGARFVPLPARPMAVVEVPVTDLLAPDFERRLAPRLRSLPADAVVQLRPAGPRDPQRPLPGLSGLRRLAPPGLHLEWSRAYSASTPRRYSPSAPAGPSTTSS